MRKLILLTGIIVFYFSSYSQEVKSITTTNVCRINLINPGIDYEVKVLQKSTLSINLGVGYGVSYKELTTSASGWLYMYSPFLDLQLKHYYNLENRNKKGRSIEYNSGNFFGIRLLSRGKAFDSNFHRTSNYDFSIGPIWGSQRSYSRIHILFDIGFNYYFDGKGNGGIIPMVEINIGYNLFSK